MYSPTQIQKRLEWAEREYGFIPVYRSVAEVAQFESHLRAAHKYILDDAGVPIRTQNLTPDESQWILNEQVLSMCDHIYALTRYCWIIAEDTVMGRIQPRVAQQIVLDVIAALQDMGSSVELIILKARQLGITSIISLLIILRNMFGQGVNGVIASSDRKKSRLMAKKLFLAYDLFPCWMRPAYTSRSESEEGVLEFAAINSGFSIQHGNQMSGISRGSTPTLYLLTEVAGFTRAEEQIEASMFRAVHASPAIFGVLESTGEGDVGWWPNTWRDSKLKWPNCRLFPLFLPWMCGLELYPKAEWLMKYPIPEGWYEHRRLPSTREHVAKAEAYIATAANGLLAKHMYKPHPELPGKEHWWTDRRMPIEQQWFWEFEHQQAVGHGTEGTFFQEMASDDIESLQRSSESVFGHVVLTDLESKKRAYQLYGLSGQSIESEHEPPTDLIDYGTASRPAPRIVVTKDGPRGNFRWELIPLLHDDDEIARWKKLDRDRWKSYINGKLMVFRPPESGFDYTIGVDTSSGRGHDSTVINVTRVGRQGLADVQVAEFRSSYVSHVEAFAFVAPIAAYYATFMGRDDSAINHRSPLLSIEQVAAVGDTCQVQLQKLGFSRFPPFHRFDSKSPQRSAVTSNRRGWYTFGWSRPILLDGFVHAVKNGWYELNSPWTIDECAHFETYLTATGKEKKEHESGEHDDGIFAAAIAMQTSHMLDSLTERTKQRHVAPTLNSSLPPLDLRPYAIKMPTLPSQQVNIRDDATVGGSPLTSSPLWDMER
jgi:hypothetical protein